MQVILVILIIVNLILYHKIIKVYYFNLGYGIISEIIGAALVAVVEMLLFGMLLNLLASVFSVVGVIVLGIFIGALGIGAVYFIGKNIYKLVSKRKENNGEKKEGNTERAETLKKSVNEYKENVKSRFGNQTSPVGDRTVDEDKTINAGDTCLKTEEQMQTEEENTTAKKTVILEKEQEGGNIFCVYCGKEISRNAKFCSFCGKENHYMRGKE